MTSHNWKDSENRMNETGYLKMTRHSVLIIDNDPQTLFAASRILEKSKYNVTMALNGSSGMEFIRNSSFSLILSEFSLDDTTWSSILEAARNTTPETMVIFQTTAIDPEFKEETFKLGAHDYLFKPYQSEELLFRVKKSIENNELKQKLKLRRSFVTGCCVCKKIRFDDNLPEGGGWMDVEDFLKTEMNVLLSSTYCPECAQNVQEDLMVQIDRLKASKAGRFP